MVPVPSNFIPRCHFWMGGLAGSLINCFRVELMGFFSHLRCTCLVGITSFLVSRFSP